MYKIVYETINNTYNVRTCFKIPGVPGAPVTVQDTLPDGELYQVSYVYIFFRVNIFMSKSAEFFKLHFCCVN